MCECVKTQYIIAGWGCHRCRTYNGLQREVCRGCGAMRCSPLLPSKDGQAFETYEQAYVDDPEKLASVLKALGRA